ncbi:MAG: fatty acid desaturase [Myxococcota bacterium]
MKRAKWVRQAIRAGNDFHFMKKTPWRHNRLNLSMLAILLTGLALIFWAGTWMTALLYLPLAAVGVGTICFALFTLVIHECSHNMFVLHKDRKFSKKLNRWIGVTIATPMFTDYVRHWEIGHLVHHRKTGEAVDRQYDYTFSGPELRRQVIRLLLIPGYAMVFNPSRRYPESRWVRLAAIAVWAVFIAFSLAFLSWKVPVGVLLGFNVLQALNLMKKSLEHGGGLNAEPDPSFRTRTYFSPLGAWSAPFNINYHFEHHLNHTVPWYDLPAYHSRVAALVPPQLHPLIYSHDYFEYLAGIRPEYSQTTRDMITGDAAAMA